MHVDDTPEERAVRAEARAWPRANARPLDPHELDRVRSHRSRTEDEDRALLAEARAWQRRKAEAGWAAPAWPVEYGGRGLSAVLAGVFAAEEAGFDVVGRLFTVGVDMVGPTIMQWGTDEQRTRYLPRILRADDV